MNVEREPFVALFHCDRVAELVALRGIAETAFSGQYREGSRTAQTCSHADVCGIGEQLAQHVPLCRTNCLFIRMPQR